MTKSQLFKTIYAKELFNIARGDLGSLEILAGASRAGRPENIFFMAGQVVEKCIKAVLVAKQIPVPFTHNLEILLDRLEDTPDPPNPDSIIDLSDFASIRRYEEGNFLLDDRDIKAAVELAKEVVNWAALHSK